MPFLRHARDKRGYEITLVMHAYRPGPGQATGRTRLLYMFRTPSNRKVGRAVLEPEVMEALEHTHPDLTFDWQGMLRTAAPAAPEPERERGRHRHDRQDRSERSERRERPEKADRPDRGAAPGSGGARRDAPPADAPLAILEDETPLGRAVGAAEAARMRAAYSELTQRIAATSEALTKHPAAYPEVLATSARTGAGIPQLRAAIIRLLAERGA